ncbi:sigma-70 family RNA polymerase sigma factor [Kitasatospora herbaricolor]|uniref:RNA polymerase sigma factor n=1 Tax=Kitasatospora herbaricolor TaxID=68217 RepID=UPI002E2F65B2|nr:sigma-70 family RNA polymerase sigma factor [Kitasatospora herbaricolor]
MTTRAERSRNPVLAAYDSRLDGLFTYCLSVLCEHEAAVEAVQEVRELALRHGERLAEPGLLRAWLYSLARYCCLHRLERGPAGAPEGPPEGAAADSPPRSGDHRGELAALAWPEAAGTDPEQREALELAVRHRLSPIEVAAVLGVPADTARALLASGGTEVRRTRAALLVLLVGSCPELDRLAGAGAESWCGPVSAGRGPQPDGGRGGRVLGPGLRRELVQHVVDCPTCRGTAERVAGEVREGLTGLPGLPMLTAPAAARSGPTTVARAAGAATAAERSGPALTAVPGPATPGPRPAPATATPSTRAAAAPSAPRPARAARGGPGAAASPTRSGAPARPRGPPGPPERRSWPARPPAGGRPGRPAGRSRRSRACASTSEASRGTGPPSRDGPGRSASGC